MKMASQNATRSAVMFAKAVMVSPPRRHAMKTLNQTSAKDASKNATVTRITTMNQFVKKLVATDVEEIRSAWMTA